MNHTHFDFFTSLLSGFSLLGIFTLYCWAVWRQRKRLRSWSNWRIVAFGAGIFILAAAVLPPISAFAHEDFRGHMLQHLLMGMIAPLGLVLGAPITLLLRTLPVRAARVVAAFFRFPLISFVRHPITALLLNVGGMYVLYLTPLYAYSLSNPVVHHLIHIHFLLAGYLFTWAILAGPDLAPKVSSMGTRLGVLFISMAAHANLGKLMYGYLWPRDVGYSGEEIQAAAQIMYYGGDFAEILLVIALFVSWYRRRGRSNYSGPAFLSSS